MQAQRDAVALLDRARAEAVARTRKLYDAAKKEVRARLAEIDAGQPGPAPGQEAQRLAEHALMAGGPLDPTALDLQGIWARNDPQPARARPLPA